jgi:ribosomal protein S6--L-glutamate ligase
VTARVCAVVEAAGVRGRNPLLPPLAEVLSARDVELVAWDPTCGIDPLDLRAPDADLYLLKGDHPLCLAAAALLADAGAPCLNPAEATLAAADKARVLARIAAAGIPVPATRVLADRAELAGALAGGPRVVKPLHGAHGAGVLLLGPGEADRAADGPWLVQEPIAGDGFDRKVYGVRDRAAVRRMRFEPGRVDGVREPVDDERLARLGAAAAAAAGLVCWGADLIDGPDGPVLVDCNAFPGYRTVAEAPGWIAAAVIAALREGRCAA